VTAYDGAIKNKLGKSDDGGIFKDCGHAKMAIFKIGIFFYRLVYKLPVPRGTFRMGCANSTSAAYGTRAFVIESEFRIHQMFT